MRKLFWKKGRGFTVGLMLVLLISLLNMEILGKAANNEDKQKSYVDIYLNYISEAKEKGDTFSEYDGLKILKSKSKDELTKMGYSAKEIQMLYNGEIEKQIRYEILKRATMDTTELVELGYSYEDVSTIKKLKGDETLEQLSAYGLLANCTCYNECSEYYYDSDVNKTYFVVSYGWEWDKRPVWLLTDCVVSMWNQNFILTSDVVCPGYDVSYNRIYTRLFDKSSDTYAYTAAEDMVENDINAFIYSFNMKDGDYYVKGGYGLTALGQSGQISNAKFAMVYAHNQIGASPSFSITGELSGSFEGAEDEFRPQAIVSGIPLEIR